MTYRVLKSRIADLPDFELRVADFVKKANDHAEHMKKVGVDPEYEAFPAPRAHPEIVAAMTQAGDGRFSSDYVIVDDGPTPEQVLRAKKDRLLAVVSAMENDAEHTILPRARRRFFQMREQDIRTADAQRRKQITDENRELRVSFAKELAQKHAEEISKATPRTIDKLRDRQADEMSRTLGPDLSEEDVEHAVAAGRSEEDAAFVAEQAERARKLEAVVRHGAVLQHDIEDLTESEIDSWEPPPFPV